ncbi:hypothetical protein GCM10012275_49850 [Longimycelium tulufanense]|uniref:Uncharacterized protein n=1 Tax=Longimycelium tulufanense TaxID=907463 RepID=A0A8J3CCB3_9PSEU|nr:hypothetical protein [Longimycelium tulufanense]GGM73280.1 hypothetical protein GCM10012275_49850 [Longimycelium tulufanense]
MTPGRRWIPWHRNRSAADEALRALQAANPTRVAELTDDHHERSARALYERIVQSPREGTTARRRRFPRLRWPLMLALPAMAGVIAISLVVFGLPGREPPPSAAELLERAAAAVDTGRIQFEEIPFERQVFQRSTQTRRYEDAGYRYTVRRTVEVTMFPGGTAETRSTADPPKFDDAEQLRRWEADGRPALAGTGSSQTRGPVDYRVGPARIGYDEMLRLPQDPGKLAGTLRTYAPATDMFELARELMVAPGLPTPLRAALYRVLAALPSVEVGEQSPERVVVAHSAAGQREELTFDPSTGSLLETRTSRAARPGQPGDQEVVIQAAGLINCIAPETRPSEIVITCADANYLVSELQWRDWGGEQAHATGTAWVNPCDPSCAESEQQPFPARVVLSERRSCGYGLTVYTRVEVIYTGPVPPGLDRNDVHDFPCAP